MGRKAFLFLVLVTFAAACAYAQGSGEQLTITTYYPSPYGSYNELQANRFSVGDANRDGQINSSDLPTVNGTVAFEPRTGGNPSTWGDGARGQLAYSNNQNIFYYHDGSGWQPLGKRGKTINMNLATIRLYHNGITKDLDGTDNVQDYSEFFSACNRRCGAGCNPAILGCVGTQPGEGYAGGVLVEHIFNSYWCLCN